MQIRVSAPGKELKDSEIAKIERDLEKIDRRLHDWKEIFAEVRISNGNPALGNHVVVELEYGRNHLIAKADHKDVGTAVREAREDLLRQINDRSRGGHSSIVKNASIVKGR